MTDAYIASEWLGGTLVHLQGTSVPDLTYCASLGYPDRPEDITSTWSDSIMNPCRGTSGSERVTRSASGKISWSPQALVLLGPYHRPLLLMELTGVRFTYSCVTFHVTTVQSALKFDCNTWKWIS